MNLSQIYIHVYKCRRVLLPFLHFFLFPSLFLFLSFSWNWRKKRLETCANVARVLFVSNKKSVRTLAFHFRLGSIASIIYVDNKALRYVFYTDMYFIIFFPPRKGYKFQRMRKERLRREKKSVHNYSTLFLEDN